ncbi:unnamed protein product, partial [Ectocarpus sp. 8 AP-2014]
VQIATIVPSPTVEASSTKIYMQTTPTLFINGTNFNTKTTTLYFNPPLEEGVVIHQKISITKIFNDDNPYVWADEPGPLKIVAINTGGGRLALNPADGGIIIAEVHADFDYGPLAMQDHKSLESFQIS